MLHRHISQLPEVGDGIQNQVQYNDDITGELRYGFAHKIEWLDQNTAFVYIVDNDPNKNDKLEPAFGNPGTPNFVPEFKYTDIMVFDDKPNNLNGWARDSIKENYDKYTDSEDYE